jgi:transposase
MRGNSHVRFGSAGRRDGPLRGGTALRSDTHYWAVDLLEDLGCRVHLAHPLGNAWGNRRVKNDPRDAEDLVDLLRLGRLAEAWIAPKEVRELRELVRHRAKLVSLHTNLKLQVYSVLAKEKVPSR